jgi:hypothetical protein
MAILSGVTLIRSLALFHITLAYFFLTNPKIISDQSVVFVLGEAMQLVGRVQRTRRYANNGVAHSKRLQQAYRRIWIRSRYSRFPRNQRFRICVHARRGQREVLADTGAYPPFVSFRGHWIHLCHQGGGNVRAAEFDRLPIRRWRGVEQQPCLHVRVFRIVPLVLGMCGKKTLLEGLLTLS